VNVVARWILLTIVVLVIVGLLVYARGRTHHRGDDVGATHGGARFGASARAGL